MAKFGYLSNIISSKSKNNDISPTSHDIPACRMVQLSWEAPINLGYINIGTNKLSRKYSDLIENNNNNNNNSSNYAVLLISDESGFGYVGLYGKITEFKDNLKKEKMFPIGWKDFFPFNPNKNAIDPNFVVLTLWIEKIEFTSFRLGFDTVTHKDWKPFILKRNINDHINNDNNDNINFDQIDPRSVKWVISE